MSDDLRIDLSNAVAEFFVKSSDFNGLPLRDVKDILPSHVDQIKLVIECVKEGLITAYFDSTNPHIKRISGYTTEQQLELLETEDENSFCLYPSAAQVEKHIDTSVYNDRPFTKMMLLGHAQLELPAFDMSVLNRYFDNPNYRSSFYDYAGKIEIGSEAYDDDKIPDRDKIVLQSFGIGYDDDGTRYTVAFLRYLSDMTPEHQQSWNSYLTAIKVLPCKEYYERTIMGSLGDTGSFQRAITYELRAINKILESIAYGSLFKEDFADRIPRELSVFTQQTLRAFNQFISTFDKMLSDNISRSFFKDKVALEFEEERGDGKIIVSQKSTLRLLEEWLKKDINWDNDEEEAMKVIVGPLKAVRKMRQKPAHQIEKDAIDLTLDDKRREILIDVYVGLMNLRRILSKHPRAIAPELPKFIQDHKVKYF